MKINFLRSAGRLGLYVSLALVGLIFVNCSKDDDTPPTYEFEEQFEDLEEIPDVEDEDPEITEPDTGSVVESEEKEEVTNDLEDGGEVSEETKETMEEVGTFSETLSEETQETAANLTDEKIDEIMESEDLNADLEATATAIENAPEKVKAMLPKVDFGEAFEGEFSAQTTILNTSLVNKGSSATKQQTNACEASAQKAYEDALAPAIAKRQENLGVIEVNYVRREGEAQVRFDNRLEALDQSYATYKAQLKEGAIKLLALSETYKEDDPDLAKQIKELALLYTLGSRKALNDWYASGVTKITNKKTAEINNAAEIRDTKNAEEQAKFDAVKAHADAKLQTALSQCHNQGSGS